MSSGLRIRFLDVGQGDATVGVLPGGKRAFVVDAFSADRVMDFLEAFGVSEVVVFLTHSDLDHTLGAIDLLTALTDESSQIRVIAVFYSRDRLNAANGSHYARLTRFIGWAKRRLSRKDPRNPSADFNTRLNHIQEFRDLFTPVSVTVVHPENADQDSLVGDTNETAGVLLIEHCEGRPRGARVLLAADVQLAGISLLMDREAECPIRADVLKFPHHGAWPDRWPRIRDIGVRRMTMSDFLNRIKPRVVVFSVGEENSSGHIRREVLDLLTDYHEPANRLETVRWTQLTDSCVSHKSAVRYAKVFPPEPAGDIDVLCGESEKSGTVEISCSSGLDCVRFTVAD